MKLCSVTGALPVARGLSELNQVPFVTLQDMKGNTLIAADPLGVKTGEQVLVTERGTQAVLGANNPADALVVCVLTPKEA